MPDWFSDKGVVDSAIIGDRGFQYGDGLFETIAIRNGEPRLWQYHMDRLTKGCECLAIKVPAQDYLIAGLAKALRLADHSDDHCVAKIIVSSGDRDRGYARPFVAAPSVFFGVFPSTVPAMKSYRDGIDTRICKTRLASNSALAGLKTLNRLEQVLARSEIYKTEVFEGLTMDAADNIICGTMSNLFIVNNGDISTPSLASCGVEGVMRRHLIETLMEQGISTDIQAIRLADMNNSDEIFISNSQFGVLPVRRCAQTQWSVGEITKKVMAILADAGVAECRL